ncbi:MAG: DUF937 domain-containing protein [Alphaproteobacteria bacterium]|jgi:uncharacterized protein YidB (DUF937 family)|nr:DUF937 domain-containing protein [Alphaproteobacteria bacterium]
MSLLKSLTDMVLNAGGQKAGLAGMVMQNPKLMDAAMGLLSKDSPVGGVQGLLGNFQNAGLGDAAQSWLGDGANKPVAGADIEKALGGNVVQDLAAKADMAPSDASNVLAEALPAMIDKVTPKGEAEDMDFGSLQSMLGGFLKGKL